MYYDTIIYIICMLHMIYGMYVPSMIHDHVYSMYVVCMEYVWYSMIMYIVCM